MGGRAEGTDPPYQEVRPEWIAEFRKEDDYEKTIYRFNTAFYRSIQRLLMFYACLKRQVSIVLPEANEVTIKRLVRDRFVQTMSQALTEMKLATVCGVDDMDLLLRIVRNADSATMVSRVKPSELYFREFSRVTVKGAFPMLLTEEIFKQLRDAKLLSLIDLPSGYWQLPGAAKDRKDGFLRQ